MEKVRLAVDFINEKNQVVGFTLFEGVMSRRFIFAENTGCGNTLSSPTPKKIKVSVKDTISETSLFGCESAETRSIAILAKNDWKDSRIKRLENFPLEVQEAMKKFK